MGTVSETPATIALPPLPNPESAGSGLTLSSWA
jgi:hypothetical protein